MNHIGLMIGPGPVPGQYPAQYWSYPIGAPLGISGGAPSLNTMREVWALSR